MMKKILRCVVQRNDCNQSHGQDELDVRLHKPKRVTVQEAREEFLSRLTSSITEIEYDDEISDLDAGIDYYGEDSTEVSSCTPSRRSSCSRSAQHQHYNIPKWSSSASPQKPILANKKAKESSVSKKVSFSTIEIRKFPIILGDNPAVSRGAALAIDWEYCRESVSIVDMEDYEWNRPLRKRPFELKMESLDRFRLLQRIGYSNSEIVLATQGTDVARDRRQRSYRSVATKMVDALALGQRAICNATIRRGTKQRERDWLKQNMPLTEKLR